jgi:hypothetical protein
MKKIRAILSLFLIFLFSWGCAAPAPYINLSQPWQGIKEKSVYDVSFYYYLDKDKQYPNLQDQIITDSLDDKPRIEIADGELEYIIEQLDAQKNTWQLTSQLEITYLSKEDMQDKLQDEYNSFESALGLAGIKNLGATDTMTSTVAFSMEKGKLFGPTKVTKNFDMPSAEISLEYSFDYQSRTLSYAFGDDEQTKITYKPKEIKSGYDNELLFLLTRSLDRDSFVPGFSASFRNIYNWTDTVDRGGIIMAYTIDINVHEDLKNIPITDEFLPFVEEQIIEGENKLPVKEVQISKSSAYESGPSLTAWYSVMDINADGSYAQSLMIKTIQNIFDVSTTQKVFCVSYDITSLEITKG